MPALRKDSELLVTKTAFPLLISPLGFIDVPGEAEQRKGEIGESILENRCIPKSYVKACANS